MSADRHTFPHFFQKHFRIVILILLVAGAGIAIQSTSKGKKVDEIFGVSTTRLLSPVTKEHFSGGCKETFPWARFERHGVSISTETCKDGNIEFEIVDEYSAPPNLRARILGISRMISISNSGMIPELIEQLEKKYGKSVGQTQGIIAEFHVRLKGGEYGAIYLGPSIGSNYILRFTNLSITNQLSESLKDQASKSIQQKLR